jgi:hypothetical protein
MAIEWFMRDGSGVCVHSEDSRLLLIGDSPPDYVRSPPETPDIGARTFKVTGIFLYDCPKCREWSVWHLKLEDGYNVAQCMYQCGYVWYRVEPPIQ